MSMSLTVSQLQQDAILQDASFKFAFLLLNFDILIQASAEYGY